MSEEQLELPHDVYFDTHNVNVSELPSQIQAMVNDVDKLLDLYDTMDENDPELDNTYYKIEVLSQKISQQTHKYLQHKKEDNEMKKIADNKANNGASPTPPKDSSQDSEGDKGESESDSPFGFMSWWKEK